MSELPGNNLPNSPDGYFAHMEQELADIEYVEQTRSRVRSFLAERGVVFEDGTGQPPAWMYDEDALEAYYGQTIARRQDELGRALAAHDHLMAMSDIAAEAERIGQRLAEAEVNESHVKYLADIIAKAQLAAERGELPPADQKRLIQALCLAAGYDGPWLELVDRELPGEPLDEAEDAELVVRVIAWRQDQLALLEARRASVAGRFEDLYSYGGTAAIDAQERAVLERLSSAYCIQAASNKLGNSLSWPEEARAILFSYGVTITPRWQRIIEYSEAAQ